MFATTPLCIHTVAYWLYRNKPELLEFGILVAVCLERAVEE